jgi:hypothetical protein
MTIGCDMRRTPKRRRRATQKDAAGAALVARAVEVGSGPRRPRRVRHDLAQARNKSARDQHSPFAEHHRRKKKENREKRSRRSDATWRDTRTDSLTSELSTNGGVDDVEEEKLAADDVEEEKLAADEGTLEVPPEDPAGLRRGIERLGF